MDAIVRLLEQEHEDVEELAESIWKLVDDARRDRDIWVVGVNYDGVGQFLFGTYESEATARKDIEGRGNIKGLRKGDIGKVFKVLTPTKIFDDEPTQGELFDLK